MSAWKEKICQGNHCFNQQHWHLAEKAYLNAARELEQEWFTNLTDVPLMMAWIANMHNLATLYETTQRPQMASPFFVQPYQRILILMREENLPGEFQSSLLHAMRTVIIPLLDFSKRYPICECCQKQLEKMKGWLNQMPSCQAFPCDKGSCQSTLRKKQLSGSQTIH
ncbi:hypothetical protein [Endozoicomonas sp. ALD040]|uniref:hypothetical protein n=1 Tax=Endozoicomonas sp. ALD040 TaxID=3403079 RepID=UPI003BB10443